MSDHNEPDRQRRRLVCIGLRLDTRSRLASFFLDDEGNRYLAQAGPRPRCAGVGVRVAFDAEGAPVLAGEDAPRYLGRLAVEDPRVLEWTAEQRLAELSAEQEARARRDADEDAIGSACRPLRVLYRQAGGRASARRCWPC